MEGVARDAETIVDVLADLEGAGYTTQLAARADARVECLGCRTSSPADAFRLDALHRLEGVSDPADMLGIAALVCPACERSGALVLNYGPQATSVDADVLAALEATPT